MLYLSGMLRTRNMPGSITAFCVHIPFCGAVLGGLAALGIDEDVSHVTGTVPGRANFSSSSGPFGRGRLRLGCPPPRVPAARRLRPLTRQPDPELGGSNM